MSQRYQNEVHVWNAIHRGGLHAVPLVGFYSTEKHPYCLVYEYMNGLDLKQYLRSKPDAARLEMVLDPLHALFAHCLMLLGDSWQV